MVPFVLDAVFLFQSQVITLGTNAMVMESGETSVIKSGRVCNKTLLITTIQKWKRLVYRNCGN